MQPHSTDPTAPEERIDFLDSLRGIAIFGIFVMNLAGLSFYGQLSEARRAGLDSAATDPLASFIHGWLGEGKFYSIFSLLFGIGFAVQLSRAAARGADGIRLFRRRLLILMAIGYLHMQFIWDGDILFLYAALGLLLPLFAKLSDAALLRWAAVLLVLPVPLQVIVTLTGGAANPGGWLRSLAISFDGPLGFTPDTDFPAFIAQAGLADHLRYVSAGPLWRLSDLLGSHRVPKVLSMFLLGLCIGRSGALGSLEAHRGLLRRVAAWGLALGLPACFLMAQLREAGAAFRATWPGVLHAAAYAAGVAPLGLAYAALLAILWTRPAGRRWLSLTAPVGRMALTNYLSQSLVGIGIFYGLGLGYAGQLGPTWFVPLALTVYGLQLAASTLWLAYFRYGPAEWAWRSLTYGERQPMLRPTAAVQLAG